MAGVVWSMWAFSPLFSLSYCCWKISCKKISFSLNIDVRFAWIISRLKCRCPTHICWTTCSRKINLFAINFLWNFFQLHDTVSCGKMFNLILHIKFQCTVYGCCNAIYLHIHTNHQRRHFIFSMNLMVTWSNLLKSFSESSGSTVSSALKIETDANF